MPVERWRSSLRSMQPCRRSISRFHIARPRRRWAPRAAQKLGGFMPADGDRSRRKVVEFYARHYGECYHQGGRLINGRPAAGYREEGGSEAAAEWLVTRRR